MEGVMKLCLIVLVVAVAVALLAPACQTAGQAISDALYGLTTNDHAREKHGADAAEATAALFDEAGRCGNKPSMVFTNADQKMMVCYLDETRAAIHVETLREGRTITDIPAEQMSRPVRYLRNTILNRGYSLDTQYGVPPAKVLEMLLEIGVFE